MPEVGKICRKSERKKFNAEDTGLREEEVTEPCC